MGRFLVKVGIFALSLATLLLAVEALLTAVVPWRGHEDPRARLLWDGAYDGSSVVLLGGSEFNSLYVRSLSTDALWLRLEARAGRRVFPGALNGARPADITAAAVHVSREWPSGTAVFISLSPTRFLESRAPEAPGGNFAPAFFRRYGIDATDSSILRGMEGRLYVHVLRPFLASRTRGILSNLVDRPRPPGWMRQRVWFEENDIAKPRFEFFERHLVMGARPRTFQWLDEIQRRLESAGMRPVFVLTPLNEALVRSFARLYTPDRLMDEFHASVAPVKTHLEEGRANVLDLTDGFPAECFFDLIHVNACGDDLIATSLADWLARHADDRSN